MSLGYDVNEDTRTFEKEGITGTVTRYSKGVLEYPCYIVKPPFAMYKIKVLQTMFQKVSTYNEDDSLSLINLYFEDNSGRLASLGKIYPRQVNSFLKLFEGNEITGYYTDGSELKGDYLYVLGG